MPEVTRRSAITAALFTGVAGTAQNDAAAQNDTFTKDQEFVTAAGLTGEEGDCWRKLAEAAGAFFKLPELHAMDKQEVASAVHLIQNKLLSRPTYRRYLELTSQNGTERD